MTSDSTRPPVTASGRRLASLSLLALGIVYGDIGTSPLYALRECFHGQHAVALTLDNVYGVLSLIFWTLVTVVTVKYHVYVIRFDNRGEGGILALLGLLGISGRRRGKTGAALVVMGVFGAALLYGDGMITPAISVLSAVEGLEVATPVLKPYVLPATIAILIALFAFQKRGTAGVGIVFGPVMLAWFTTLAVFGIRGILMHPGVLASLNPAYAVDFFARNGFHGLLVLGAVFLVATGGEALYADLGHFGERPIQIDWFTVAAPALMLQYLGQGALLIARPESAPNPFYLLAPAWSLYAVVALATGATIIASQAIISGAFSLTRQAIQLGYLPRMRVIHTSSSEMGQIYMPTVNWALMVATIVLVAGFGSSSAIAGAYGVAVSTTMIITTVLACVVARDVHGWKRWTAVSVTAMFLVADAAFLIANYAKIAAGGWLPLLVAAIVFVLMTTWRSGRERLSEKLREAALPQDQFVDSLRRRPPVRVPGTAVFMNRNPGGVPSSLLHSLKHYRALHERVILLTVDVADVARIGAGDRLEVEHLGEGVHRLTARFGYMEEIDIPAVLGQAADRGLEIAPMETTYFLSRETVVVTSGTRWNDRLFASMMRNAESAARYFHLPPNRVVELGAQVVFAGPSPERARRIVGPAVSS